MQPKYQIFISSTYEDLKSERQEVMHAILQLGHIPIGMELFDAANETQWEMIKRRIEESDYYVVIIAHRYGSTEPNSNLSYTEMEYDYAVSKNVPVLAFTINPNIAWPQNLTEKDDTKRIALSRFVEKVERKMRKQWDTKDKLALEVMQALIKTMIAHPRTGWVRADQTVSPDIANEILRLSKENSELREQLESAKTQPLAFPQITAKMSIAEGRHQWGKVVTARTENGTPLYIDNYHEGYWYSIEINNLGTATTDVDVIFDVDVNATRRDDLLAINDDLNKVLNERHTWRYYTKNEDHYRLMAILESMQPGHRRFLLLPAPENLSDATFDTIEFSLNVYPKEGNFIQSAIKLRDLPLPELSPRSSS